MEVNLVTLLITIVKIVAVIAWVYGLLWVMSKSRWLKIIGIIAAFGVIQLALTFVRRFPDFQRL